VQVPNVTDPPLKVDELPGWLEASSYWPQGWLCWPGGWFGQVTYGYPMHGLGTGNYIEWFPAVMLRRAESEDPAKINSYDPAE
jgi:hypothetical protein